MKVKYKCSECKKTFEIEKELIAYFNCKKVCNRCFDRLKMESKSKRNSKK